MNLIPSVLPRRQITSQGWRFRASGKRTAKPASDLDADVSHDLRTV
jgi:hypothetical protein